MRLILFSIQKILYLAIVLSSYTCFAQDIGIEEKIKSDVVKRVPDAKIHRVQKKHWGEYWVFSKSKKNLKKQVSMKSSYTHEGAWKLDMWYLKKEGTPQAIVDELAGSEDVILSTSYIEDAQGFKNYKVELTSGRFRLFNEALNEIEYGPLKDDIEMTDNLKEKINERLINPQIVRGYKTAEGHLSFSVVFETDNGHNNPGKIVFDKNLEWITTIHDLENYSRLPLELLMYVNDNGGKKTFKNIKKVESNKGTYYDVRQKDGQHYMLDVGLNKI